MEKKKSQMEHCALSAFLGKEQWNDFIISIICNFDPTFSYYIFKDYTLF